MSSYRVELNASAATGARALDARSRHRVLAGIAELEQDPRSHEALPLPGYENVWTIRIAGYRVLYDIKDHQRLVTIVRLRHPPKRSRAPRG